MYAALKALHILAVALFLGNIVTGLFWKVHGDRTGDPRRTEGMHVRRPR